MTPREFAQKYWDLDVFMIPSDAPPDDPRMDPLNAELPPGDWQKTRVASYRLGQAEGGYRMSFWSDIRKHIDDPKGKEAIQVVVKTIDGKIETKLYRSYGELAYSAVSSWIGKGNPEEAQIALQLRYRFQKVKLALPDFAKASFIGLDCNGFVGNYISRCVNGNGWYRRKPEHPGCESFIRSLYQLGTPIRTMEALAQERNSTLILALCDQTGYIADHGPNGLVGHIMITQPGELTANGKTVTATVLESTPPMGLVESPYDFLSVNKAGVFNVYRGAKQHNMPVVVSRL
jgi:hypothetical protein